MFNPNLMYGCKYSEVQGTQRWGMGLLSGNETSIASINTVAIVQGKSAETYKVLGMLSETVVRCRLHEMLDGNREHEHTSDDSSEAANSNKTCCSCWYRLVLDLNKSPNLSAQG